MLSWARSTAASYLSSPADTLGSLGQEPAAAAPAVAPAVTALAALEERGSAGSSELRALEASLRADAAAGDAPGADRGAFERAREASRKIAALEGQRRMLQEVFVIARGATAAAPAASASSPSPAAPADDTSDFVKMLCAADAPPPRHFGGGVAAPVPAADAAEVAELRAQGAARRAQLEEWQPTHARRAAALAAAGAADAYAERARLACGADGLKRVGREAESMGALADAAAVALHALSPPPDAEAAARLNELVQRTGALAKALEEQLDALSPALDAAATAVVDAALPDAAAAATDAAARLRTQADECRAALRAAREAAAAKGDHAAHCLLAHLQLIAARRVLGGA